MRPASPLWLGLPLVFAACNAIVGLDPGEPLGAGGAGSSSSKAAQSSSTGFGAKDGGPPACGLTKSQGPNVEACNFPDGDCRNTNAFDELRTMAGTTGLVTLTFDKLPNGMKSNDGQPLDPQSYLTTDGIFFDAVVPKNAKLGYTAAFFGMLLGVTPLCNSQPCSPSSYKLHFVKPVVAFGLVLMQGPVVVVHDPNGHMTGQVPDKGNEVEIVTYADPAGISEIDLGWLNGGSLHEIYTVPCL